MKPIFNLGDLGYVARYGNTTRKVSCPVCFGGKTILCILGDGENVTIGCSYCAYGYESPIGFVDEWTEDIDISTIIIDRITLENSGYEYNGQKNVFKTESEARAHGEILKKDHLDYLQNQTQWKKEYEKKSWSWHIGYFKKQIKDAEEQIKYAKEKLRYAEINAKV